MIRKIIAVVSCLALAAGSAWVTILMPEESALESFTLATLGTLSPLMCGAFTVAMLQWGFNLFGEEPLSE